MKFKQLEAFVCVAELKSFSKAGKKLYLTQPTISAHIQSLEQELGCRMLVRTTKEVVLSQEGERLYGYAKQLVQLEQRIYKEFQHQNISRSDTISAGASSVPGQYLLPQILALFNRTYPDYRLELMENDSRGIARQVAEGQIEIGFTSTKTEDENCVFEPFYTDRLVVAAPPLKAYDKYAGTGFPLEQLYLERMIVREEGSGTRKETEKFLVKAGVRLEELKIVATMNNQETIKKSVSSGMGIAILSGVSVEDWVKQGRMRAFPFSEVEPSRSLYMVWNKTRKPGAAAKVLIQFVRDLYETYR